MKLLFLFLLFNLQLSAQKPVKKTPDAPKQTDEIPSLNFGFEKEMKAITDKLVPRHKIVNKPVALTESQKKKIREIDAFTGNFRTCTENCLFPFEEFEQKQAEWPKEKLNFMVNKEKIAPAQIYAYFKKDELQGFSILLAFETYFIKRTIALDNNNAVFISEKEIAGLSDKTPYQGYYYLDGGDLFYIEKKGDKRFTPDQHLPDIQKELKHDLPLLVEAVKKQFLSSGN